MIAARAKRARDVTGKVSGFGETAGREMSRGVVTRTEADNHEAGKRDRRRAACGIGLEMVAGMRKTNNKSLTLKTQTVRSLQENELSTPAGGWTIWTEATSCTPTQIRGCVPKTPGCPM